MYPTSIAYRVSNARSYRTSDISGTISSPQITITADVIKDGTLCVDNQCTKDDTDITVGTCCIGEISFELYDTTTSVGRFIGNTVTMNYKQLIAPDTWEEIPLGIFEIVSDTKRTSGATVKIVGYDNMHKLDVEITGGAMITDTVENISNWVCDSCGVTLDVLPDCLPNRAVTITYSQTHSKEQITTYRDLLHYLCQIMGAFCTAGRDGKICIRPVFYATPDIPISPVTQNFRTKTELYDFMMEIGGASMTLTKYLLDSNTAETIRYPDEVSSGKIIELDANPLYLFMSTAVKRSTMQALAEKLMLISYIPASIETFGDPALDLGDYVEMTGGICGDGADVMITHSRWTFRGKQSIEAAGDKDSGLFAPPASRTTGDDYIFDIMDGEATLIMYIGKKKNIIVPATVTYGEDDIPVTAIASTCFNCSEITNAVIPFSVTRIM